MEKTATSGISIEFLIWLSLMIVKASGSGMYNISWFWLATSIVWVPLLIVAVVVVIALIVKLWVDN